jgi:perosamine synthetase
VDIINQEGLWRVGQEEIGYLTDVINDGFKGKYTRIFEENFSSTFGIDYSIAVNSGTSALHTALLGLGVEPGDEIIVPPLTFIATAFAALYIGAVPVFADIDPDTFNISPESIEKNITAKTKGIIVVSLYGLPAEMDEIIAIAKKYNLSVLEDNAECILGRYKEKIAGTIGHASIFSFQRSKHLTTGDGGMIITNNSDVAERCRKYSDLGYKALTAKPVTNEDIKDQIQHFNYKRHELIGYNYRMPELCAAVGIAQLNKINYLLDRRLKSAAAYDEILQDCNFLIPQKTNVYIKHSFWTYAVKLDTDKVSWDNFRKVFLSFGGEKFYGAWSLSYLEPALFERKFSIDRLPYRKGLCPIAEAVQPKIIQFKTNFETEDQILLQKRALQKTLDEFC